MIIWIGYLNAAQSDMSLIRSDKFDFATQLEILYVATSNGFLLNRLDTYLETFFFLKKQKLSIMVEDEESTENDEDLQNVISDLVVIERSQVLPSIVSVLTHS